MSLLERRLQVEREARLAKEQALAKRKRELAEKIINGFKKEGLTEIIEENLVQYGAVVLSKFGCLCQKGCCSWQAGFTEHLSDLMREWAEKGVAMYFRIDGVELRLKGANSSSYIPKIDHVTLGVK